MTPAELLQARADLRAKKDTLRALLASVPATRDFTPEEGTRVNALTRDYDILKSRIDSAERLAKTEAASPVQNRSKPFAGIERQFANISTSKTRRDLHEYSIVRAFAQLSGETPSLEGIERERHQELTRSRGPSKGHYLDLNAKLRGKHKVKYRALNLSTGTGSVGVLVEPTLIELLRARLVFSQLGGSFYPNCVGKFSLPRQSASSQYYFVGEATDVTPSNPVLDQVAFTPKTMGISVPITRKFMLESSIDALTMVEEDVAKAFTVGLDATALAGSGTGSTPLGILGQSSVTTITLAADAGNGGAMTYADALAFETAITNSNADQGSLGWATTPGIRAKLKQAPILGNQFPSFVWSPDNQVTGYDALVTTNMPRNLTKGSGTNLNSIIFGNWNDAVLAMWSGVDVIIDPYTQAAQGGVIYNALIEVDFQLRHGTSFAVCGAVNVS